MKKISVLLFGLFVAGQAFAQLTGTPCTDGTASAIAPAAPSFVVLGFTPRCSANVNAAYEMNTIAFVVGSASTKGKNRFRGTTGGGAISGAGCAGVTCTANDASTGLTALLATAT